MNNVMTKGFAELTAEEMNKIDGGWEVTITVGPVSFGFDDKDVKAVANWYTNTYVPAAEDFGAKVHQYFFT